MQYLPQGKKSTITPGSAGVLGGHAWINHYGNLKKRLKA